MAALSSTRPEQYWGAGNAQNNGASVKEIFSSVTNEAQTLARQEANLAKVEVKRSLAEAGRAGALFTGGGLMGFLALQAFTIAAGFGLAAILPTGVAFLIVGVAYLLITGLLLLLGRKHLAGIEPPRRAIDTVKQDIKAAKAAFSHGMSR